jgi:YVTN family beta-propeller protein
MPAPDGKTLFIQIGTLYSPPNTEVDSRFTAVFDMSDPYRPVQLSSVAVGAGEDTRDHALTGDGKLLVVPNRLDKSVSVIDVGSRQVVRTISTVDKPHRVATFGEGIRGGGAHPQREMFLPRRWRQSLPPHARA